jgi:hypothetical protein
MSSYRDIPDAETLQDAPVTQVLIQGLRDNAIASGFAVGKGQITPTTIPASTATQNTSGAAQWIAGHISSVSGTVDIQTSPDGVTWTTQQRLVTSTGVGQTFGFPLPVNWRWRWVQVSGGPNTLTRAGLTR